MSSNSATGSAAPSVQKWIIDVDVVKQLCSRVLKRRLQDESLFDGSIELYLRCLNLTAIWWGGRQAFNKCYSLLRVDFSGCPKLESIPECAFAECHHLVSEVFGEHSNITNIGAGVFQKCSALSPIS